MKKEKKCSACKHGAKFHYKSEVDGRPTGIGGITKHTVVVCSKDNCTAWNRCDQDGWNDEELLGQHK